MNIKAIFASALLATGLLAGASNASTFLDATFDIRVGSFNAGGSASNAQADVSTLLAETDEFGTYTGMLDFNIGSGGSATTTIGDFFASGTGVVSGLSAGLLSQTLSTPTFQDTTIFFFSVFLPDAFTGSISHDDGITFGDSGVIEISSTAPTTVISNDYDFSGGGFFEIIYVAANGNPSVLEVTRDVAPVPLPAALPMLLAGLGGLGVAARRKRKAA